MNYAASYLVNPGFLPWNWWHTRKHSYTISELQNGIATNTDQVMWAKVHGIPNRCHFSRKYGLFILRADHDCGWLNGWVGVGNHSHFVRSVMYTFGLLCLALFWMVRAGLRGEVEGPKWFYWLNLIGSVIVTSVVTRQSFEQAIRLTSNLTSLEVLKGSWEGKKNPYDKGNCFANWDKVCRCDEFH
jgi:hypothetical protein